MFSCKIIKKKIIIKYNKQKKKKKRSMLENLPDKQQFKRSTMWSDLNNKLSLTLLKYYFSKELGWKISSVIF